MEDKSRSDEGLAEVALGAALRRAVEAGLGDAALGAFATNLRADLDQAIGRGAPPPVTDALDLIAVVQTAVRTVMNERGYADKPKSRHLTVVVAGKRTSISISADIFDRCSQRLPERGAVRNLVSQLATTAVKSAPKGSISRWIEDRLVAFLASPVEDAISPTGPGPRH